MRLRTRTPEGAEVGSPKQVPLALVLPLIRSHAFSSPLGLDPTPSACLWPRPFPATLRLGVPQPRLFLTPPLGRTPPSPRPTPKPPGAGGGRGWLQEPLETRPPPSPWIRAWILDYPQSRGLERCPRFTWVPGPQ